MKKLVYLFCFLVLVLFCQRTEAQQMVSGPSDRAAEDTIKANIQKAQLLVRQGKKEEASQIFTSIMATNPDNKEAVQWWLITNMKRSPTGEVDAIPMLDSLNKVYPANTAIRFFKIFIQTEYGMNKEALESVEQLIVVQPDSGVNYILKGQILQGLDRHEEACAAFEKALALDPSRFDVWGMEAASRSKLGQPDQAIKLLNKAIELAPGFTENYYNRACIYSLQGNKRAALDDLKKAFSMKPEFKKYALTDSDLKSLYDDAEFKELTK